MSDNTTRNHDRNLLFGVLAVQLKQVTPSQLVEAAALWAAGPDKSLADRLVHAGALTKSDRTLLDEFVDRAINANQSDVTKTLAAFGGDDEVVNSFQGTVVRTPEGWNVRDETVAGAPPPDVASKSLHEEPVGRYHERGEQGRGGMGRVLLVDDRDLGREIVMKVLLDDSSNRSTPKARSGDQQSASKQSRFLQEAQITGQLEHPSIVPVYELGQRKNATPYYTMKYVRGDTLSKAIRRCSTMAERLALLPHYVDLCQAIAYAHSRGVIHRDLKPSNVMVGEYGETVVIDWGLAKIKGRRDVQATQLEDGLKTVHLDSDSSSSSDRTKMGEVMGTPVYMPPEQARGDIEAIDERSDVYALGVILYQIVTGQKPFTAATPEKIVEKVINESPQPIDEAAPDAPPELVAICKRAMLKDQDARYAGAQALSEEIERFQSGAVVQAYEYRPAEYVGKFIRRHRPIVTTAAVALVAIIALSAWYVTSILGANQDLAAARDLETDLREAAELEAYQSAIVLAQNEIVQQESAAAQRILRNASDRLRNWEWGYLHRVSDQSLMTLASHSGALTWGQFSSDGTIAVTASADGTLRVWDTRTGAERFTLRGHGVKVFGGSILSEEERLVSVSVDGIVKIWNLTNGELVRSFGDMQPDIRGMAVSSNGERLATASLSGSVTVFSLTVEGTPRTIVLDEAGLWGVAFDADGRRVIAGSESGKVALWDADTGAVLRTFEGHTERVRAVAFSPDGTRLVTGADDDTAIVWDARSGAVLQKLVGHESDVVDVQFAEEGQSAITASLDKTARVWNATSGSMTQTLSGHTQGLIGVSLSADGQSILTSSEDGSARVWNFSTGAEQLVLSSHSGDVTHASFSPNNERILTVSNDQTAKLWHAQSTSNQIVFPDHDHIVAMAAFSPDGTLAATASWDNKARIWEAATGDLVRVLEGHEGFVDYVAFSPDGRRIVTSSWDKTARIWDTNSGTELNSLEGHGDIVESAVFSPDGLHIITASPDKSARIWNAETGEEVSSITGHDTGILFAAFSPDDSRIVTTSLDRTARIWDRKTLTTTATLEGHSRAVTHAAFSPNGKHLITTSLDTIARLWNVETGELLHELTGHLEPVWGAAFNADGERAATASHDGTVRLWNVVNGAEVLTLGGQQEGIQSVAFDRTGRRMVTGSLDGTARIWEAGPWSERVWERDDQREPLVRLARGQSPERTQHVIGFDREPSLIRLEALGSELKTAGDDGILSAMEGQGLYVNSGEALPGMPELSLRKGDLLYRLNNIDVASSDDAALALEALCARIRSQTDRPHTVRFEFANFMERRIVEFRFPQLLDRELTVPRAIATNVLKTGIKNSKDNRLRWASEKGPRESEVVILTDLTLYKQVGLDAQDRLVAFNDVPISGLDSIIEAMEKTLESLASETFTSPTVLYARDRLDQLIRVTFKLTN
jgi:WD40 repeat protein/serine/threonine protein kinase